MFYKHVDVFSNVPFSGNSLSVFFLPEMLIKTKMQKIAEEMRHFESIFLCQVDGKKNEYNVKIFTVEEELHFAGHPLIGAACAVHDKYHPDCDNTLLKFNLSSRSIGISTTRIAQYYSATMDQGLPEFLFSVPLNLIDTFMSAFNLSRNNLADLPLEVVSTGLNYLIVPLKSGLEQVKHTNVSELLSLVNAKFVYFYDVIRQEGRTWDNDGNVEDIATGSAAGPVGAYLIKHGIARLNETIVIHQGSYLGRPSEIKVTVCGQNNKISRITVSGDAVMVGNGNLTAII